MWEPKPGFRFPQLADVSLTQVPQPPRSPPRLVAPSDLWICLAWGICPASPRVKALHQGTSPIPLSSSAHLPELRKTLPLPSAEGLTVLCLSFLAFSIVSASASAPPDPHMACARARRRFVKQDKPTAGQGCHKAASCTMLYNVYAMFTMYVVQCCTTLVQLCIL